jgi:carbon monoxide dehydrogenase subunit G
MKLGSSFVVPAEHARVFAHFLDPHSMRASIPGCAELERVDDAHYRGRLVNEIAHVRFSAGFSAEITQLREPEEVRAILSGEDRKLGSSIKIDAVLAVRPDGTDGAASLVDYSLDVALWGKIGRLGESIVRRRSQEVERQFVTLFSDICASGPPGPDNPALRALTNGSTTDGARADRSATAPTDRPTRRPSWWRRLLDRLFRRAPGSR